MWWEEVEEAAEAERTAVHRARRSPSYGRKAGGLPWDILQDRRGGRAVGSAGAASGAAIGRIDGSGADSCSECCLPHTVLDRRGGIKLRHERQRSHIPAPGFRPVRRRQLHLSPGTAARGSGGVAVMQSVTANGVVIPSPA